MDRRIVPVEPASGRGVTVLVQVQQEHPTHLDLQLVGCEGESPYVATSTPVHSASASPSIPTSTSASTSTSTCTCTAMCSPLTRL
jgi:hypothetical protein